jgi:hypothetical protein
MRCIVSHDWHAENERFRAGSSCVKICVELAFMICMQEMT